MPVNVVSDAAQIALFEETTDDRKDNFASFGKLKVVASAAEKQTGNGSKAKSRRAENNRHRLKVSLGTTRDLKLWGVKKKETGWGTFIEKILENPTEDNSVTIAQYFAMDKDDKNERKASAGNWSFSVYEGERRRKNEVVGRWGLVYDFDHATAEQIDFIRDGFADICEYDFHMHTTRSHLTEKPRWRLALPFNRLARPDEAIAITRLMTRYIAEDSDEGIEIVDKKSFDVNQIMFMPSISKGQEFETDRNDGAILDVDAFLEAHPEWTDPLSLPYQDSESLMPNPLRSAG